MHYLQKAPLQHKVLAGFVALFAAIGVFAGAMYAEFREVQQTTRSVNFTHEVIADARELIKLMLDQETGLRGYVIVGKENFLAPYREGVARFDDAIRELQSKVRHNPPQVALLEEIGVLAREWRDQAARPEIAARRAAESDQGDADAARELVESEVGKERMDRLRTLVDEFVKQEQALMRERQAAAEESHRNTVAVATGGGLFVLLLGLLILYVVHRTTAPMNRLVQAMREIAESSDFTQRVDASGMLEVIRIGEVFNRMATNTEQQAWLKSSALRLSKLLQEAEDSGQLAQQLTSLLGDLLECGFGAFYLLNETSGRFELLGSYRFKERRHSQTSYGPGEGLVGQCALERRSMLLTGVPEDYIMIHSGLGEAPPDTVLAIPITFGKRTLAVLELATFGRFTPIQEALLEEQTGNIGQGLRGLLDRQRTRELLERTQAQAEELQEREEELNEANTQLERQAVELQRSQAMLEEKNDDLQAQQEQLRVANEELEEKAQDLDASRAKLEERNNALAEAKQTLERHAQELSESSQYKSEFLANMSHELRTPLNSLLILSKLLMDNKDGNLTEKQIGYARTVHDSGEDLLELINDILDLSKIESGRMDVHSDLIRLSDFVTGLEAKFAPMADRKGIKFSVDTHQAPDQWYSDGQKLSQVIKNFVSNAIKFTEQGEVTITIGPPTEGLRLRDCPGDEVLAFTVSDTGIGIPEDKREVIFEAFRQADGTTSRKYGGTGLGLSISRALARLLGGEIHVSSEEGHGSAFTLLLPLARQAASAPMTPAPLPEERDEAELTATPTPATTAIEAAPMPDNRREEVPDDRQTLKAGDRSLLIIEDDARFAAIVADMARARGFGVLVADDGHTGLHFADVYRPSGIVLDIGLPDISGWQVMAQLKDSPHTRHIPVHIMSASDRSLDALRGGAIGFYTKPVTTDDLEQAFARIEDISDRPVKRLLLVEDDAVQLDSVRELLQGNDVETLSARSGEEAIRMLDEEQIDCIVLDIGLPDMNGVEVLEALRARPDAEQVPVVVYTGKDLEPKEQAKLKQYAQSIIIKDVRSPERLLDDTTLFLHRMEEELPEEQRRTLRMLHDTETLFSGRKVLVVDDDMRNVFSLTAVLEEKSMQVFTAANGQEALEQLDAEPDMALVLMDIMMPEMDGYEAMRRIRAQDRFASLPIIALTAKAMKGDRALCVEAGASDYLAKPVDSERLLSLMRVWLYK